jgi:hypothetical protein
MAEKKPLEGVATPPQESVEEGESSSQEFHTPYDAKQTKRLLRKLDLHIMPVLVILYLFSFLGMSINP